VQLLKFEGVDGLEIERRVPRDAYFSLMQEAKGAGLPVGGKVPIEVTPIEASNAGQAQSTTWRQFMMASSALPIRTTWPRVSMSFWRPMALLAHC
jgi:hypothetical protein